MYVTPRGRFFGWTLTSTTSGFGRYMANSPMVVVWPSRGSDGNYNSVTLSQRKAPYETMPKPDPHPPFKARLSKFDTWVRTTVLCHDVCIVDFFVAGHAGEPPNNVHAAGQCWLVMLFALFFVEIIVVLLRLRLTACRTSFGRSVARPHHRRTRIPYSRYTTGSAVERSTLPASPLSPPNRRPHSRRLPHLYTTIHQSRIRIQKIPRRRRKRTRTRAP
jgi:hypothetical protein